MNDKQRQKIYDLIATMWHVVYSTLKHLDEYEKIIYKNSKLKESLNDIDLVYMYAIIQDLSKLLSVTFSDNSGLKQLMEIATGEQKNAILNFFDIYKQTIEKIKGNRNRIISHLDTSAENAYYRMSISEIEANRLIKNHENYLSVIGHDLTEKDHEFHNSLQSLVSSDTGNERYNPSDFVSDFLIFREMLKKIDDFITEVNMSVYADGD
jgi:hypothetical protein